MNKYEFHFSMVKISSLFILLVVSFFINETYVKYIGIGAVSYLFFVAILKFIQLHARSKMDMNDLMIDLIVDVHSELHKTGRFVDMELVVTNKDDEPKE